MAEACPICGRKPDPKTRPFCSPRCADIDLGRWFTGQYRIPTRPEEEDTEALDPAHGFRYTPASQRAERCPGSSAGRACD